MTSTPAGAGRDRPAAGEHPDWVALVAFAVVIIALLTLAVVPAVLIQRMSRGTDDMTARLIPAYGGMMELALAMERRVSSSRSRFLTGDRRYDAQLEAARVAEAEALRQVEALAPRLGPVATHHVAELRRHMLRRDSLQSDLVAGGETVDEYLEALPQFDVLRDSALVQVVGLRRELMRVTEALAADDLRMARLQRRLSILLGTLAVIAVCLVGWFALSQRRLRRAIQRALAEANRSRRIAERRGDQLAQAIESRVRLIHGITHDVKNPLGAAKGYADILEMGIRAPMHPEQAPLVQGVQRSIGGALAIIGDLLDLARADSGGLAVHRVEVDLAEIVRAEVEDLRASAETAGHQIELQVPREPLNVRTDPARVSQILGNLISNAIKYTPPPGRIVVHATNAGEAGHQRNGRWAAVRVSDSGPGIPPDQRERIFEEFTRLEEGGGQQGHGLGLSIARRIAHLLDGELELEDSSGAGAAFVLRLPMDDEGGRRTG